MRRSSTVRFALDEKQRPHEGVDVRLLTEEVEVDATTASYMEESAMMHVGYDAPRRERAERNVRQWEALVREWLCNEAALWSFACEYQLVGLAAGKPYNGNAFLIIHFFVLPRVQRCGFGSEGVRVIEHYARERGFDALRVHVDRNRNPGAYAFWRKHGFNQQPCRCTEPCLCKTFRVPMLRVLDPARVETKRP